MSIRFLTAILNSCKAKIKYELFGIGGTTFLLFIGIMGDLIDDEDK
jgi:hypothetical protein